MHAFFIVIFYDNNTSPNEMYAMLKEMQISFLGFG